MSSTVSITVLGRKNTAYEFINNVNVLELSYHIFGDYHPECSFYILNEKESISMREMCDEKVGDVSTITKGEGGF